MRYRVPGLCLSRSAGSGWSWSHSTVVQHSHHGSPGWSEVGCSGGLDVPCPRVWWGGLLRWRFCFGGGVLDWSEEVSLCWSGGGDGCDRFERLRPGLAVGRLTDRVLSECRSCAAWEEERMGRIARLGLVVVRLMGAKCAWLGCGSAWG